MKKGDDSYTFVIGKRLKPEDGKDYSNMCYQEMILQKLQYFDEIRIHATSKYEKIVQHIVDKLVNGVGICILKGGRPLQIHTRNRKDNKQILVNEYILQKIPALQKK